MRLDNTETFTNMAKESSVFADRFVVVDTPQEYYCKCCGVKFNYKTKGTMAEIGKGTGVATIFGFRIHGFSAWWLWRTYYLGNLPTTKKKLKVMEDWTYDLIFKPDVAMIKRSGIESCAKNTQIQNNLKTQAHN